MLRVSATNRSPIGAPVGVGVHLGGGAPCDVHRMPAMPLPSLTGIENFRQSSLIFWKNVLVVG